jgi:hypothetical protein
MDKALLSGGRDCGFKIQKRNSRLDRIFALFFQVSDLTHKFLITTSHIRKNFSFRSISLLLLLLLLSCSILIRHTRMPVPLSTCSHQVALCLSFPLLQAVLCQQVLLVPLCLLQVLS